MKQYQFNLIIDHRKINRINELKSIFEQATQQFYRLEEDPRMNDEELQ
jgi:hypothetical protein